MRDPLALRGKPGNEASYRTLRVISEQKGETKTLIMFIVIVLCHEHYGSVQPMEILTTMMV